MTKHLPDRLDLFAAAEAGRELQGRIELHRLTRALALLESPDGELEVELRLGCDEDGTHFLTGSIRGNLVLRCQRCLEDMAFPLSAEFRLGLVHGQEEIRRLSDRYEPLIVSDEPVSLADIVTDEVLLALPIVPLHTGANSCHLPVMDDQAPDGAERDNPFAVLAQLKHKP